MVLKFVGANNYWSHPLEKLFKGYLGLLQYAVIDFLSPWFVLRCQQFLVIVHTPRYFTTIDAARFLRPCCPFLLSC